MLVADITEVLGSDNGVDGDGAAMCVINHNTNSMPIQDQYHKTNKQQGSITNQSITSRHPDTMTVMSRRESRFFLSRRFELRYEATNL